MDSAGAVKRQLRLLVIMIGTQLQSLLGVLTKQDLLRMRRWNRSSASFPSNHPHRLNSIEELRLDQGSFCWGNTRVTESRLLELFRAE